MHYHASDARKFKYHLPRHHWGLALDPPWPWFQKKALCWWLPRMKLFMTDSRHIRRGGSYFLFHLWVCCLVSTARSYNILLLTQRRDVDEHWSVFIQVTFVPSIPQIAKDLDLTDAVIRCVPYAGLVYYLVIERFPSLTFSLSLLANAVGALVWATYSSFCACICSML